MMTKNNEKFYVLCEIKHYLSLFIFIFFSHETN